jgi:hypothetical protein
MRHISTLLAVLALLLPLRADSLEDLMARLQARREALDFRSSGRLVLAPEAGPRQSWQIAMKGLTAGAVQRLFCEVTAPADARVRLLIESRAGRTSIRLGHPGEEAAKELPVTRWGEALLGTGFSYEDLLESHLLWKNQTLTGEEKLGARTCYVLKSEPGPGDRSHYASVTSWIDRESYYPVRMEKVARASGETKQFVAFGLRQSKGLWAASQIEVKIKGRPGSSFLIVSRGTGQAKGTARDFDAALLVRP